MVHHFIVVSGMDGNTIMVHHFMFVSYMDDKRIMVQYMCRKNMSDCALRKKF